MGFAESYLQKHAIGQPLIPSAPDPEIHSIIALPAYNESGLLTCLDSLFLCDLPGHPAEVIVLINSGVHSPPEIIDLNRKTHAKVLAWCTAHQRPGLTFHAVLLENLPKKHFGAGLARKLVMDEAVRRFNRVDHDAGIILSLDADTTVEQNYLREVTGLFDRSPDTDGCSIRFAHPVGDEESGRVGDEKSRKVRNEKSRKVRDEKSENESERELYPEAVYEAIVNYELHQRYYLEALRFTGYPYAFHTVGSAFAVRARAYCRQGGMSKRQAGEDFYFIQKVAMQGNFSECNSTTVHPSPRPSDRVPFGTGPAIAKQLDHPGESFLTYAPQLFRHLHDFYALIPDFFALDPPVRDAQQSAAPGTVEGNDARAGRSARRQLGTDQGQPGSQTAAKTMLNSLPSLLQHYLEATDFLPALAEIQGNVASEPSFRQRFYRKFNMFWILKYLHFAGEQGVHKVEVGEAARELLLMTSEKKDLPDPTLRELLETYRKVQAVPSKK